MTTSESRFQETTFMEMLLLPFLIEDAYQRTKTKVGLVSNKFATEHEQCRSKLHRVMNVYQASSH